MISILYECLTYDVTAYLTKIKSDRLPHYSYAETTAQDILQSKLEFT